MALLDATKIDGDVYVEGTIIAKEGIANSISGTGLLWPIVVSPTQNKLLKFRDEEGYLACSLITETSNGRTYETDSSTDSIIDVGGIDTTLTGANLINVSANIVDIVAPYETSTIVRLYPKAAVGSEFSITYNGTVYSELTSASADLATEEVVSNCIFYYKTT